MAIITATLYVMRSAGQNGTWEGARHTRHRIQVGPLAKSTPVAPALQWPAWKWVQNHKDPAVGADKMPTLPERFMRAFK